jgi:hypothetical protein
MHLVTGCNQGRVIGAIKGMILQLGFWTIVLILEMDLWLTLTR